MCASLWLITFSPSKSESLIFSRKVNRPYQPTFYMNYQQVNEDISHKHLDINLYKKLSRHGHLERIKAKARQRLHVMRRLKFILDRKSILVLTPLLEYAGVVWNNCSQFEPNELEKKSS